MSLNCVSELRHKNPRPKPRSESDSHSLSLTFEHRLLVDGSRGSKQQDASKDGSFDSVVLPNVVFLVVDFYLQCFIHETRVTGNPKKNETTSL